MTVHLRITTYRKYDKAVTSLHKKNLKKRYFRMTILMIKHKGDCDTIMEHSDVYYCYHCIINNYCPRRDTRNLGRRKIPNENLLRLVIKEAQRLNLITEKQIFEYFL